WSCTFWRQRAGRGGIEMAGSLPPRVLSRADPSRLRSRRVRAARWRWPLCLGALAMIAIVAAPDGALPSTRGGTNRRGMGVAGRVEADTGSLLVDYFQRFLDDRDIQAF